MRTKSMILALVALVPIRAHAGDPEPVKRGAYLVLVGGCDDCHTPMKSTPQGPHMDWARRLAGYSPPTSRLPSGTIGKTDLQLSGSDFTTYRQEFGTVFSRNLTPHRTGLGEWSEAQFIKTMRLGRHQGDGRPLLPPMPWDRFGRMTDGDLRAIFAYLRTIPAIANTPPDPQVPPAMIQVFMEENQELSALMKHRMGDPQLRAAAK
jgi:hypothetical protein